MLVFPVYVIQRREQNLYFGEDLPLDHAGPTDVEFDPFPRAALEGSLTDRFRMIARRFPDQAAVSDSTRELTYAQLQNEVESLCARITAAVAGQRGPVAILLANEGRFASAVLGVLAAGRGCVPIDADYPPARIALIARDASASAVISAGALAGKARELFPDLPVVDLNEDEDRQGFAPAAPGPNDLAYILYTSGSTGIPKGVCQNHAGVLHDVMQCTNTQHIGRHDRIVQFYSPTVISRFRVMLSALLNGATLSTVYLQWYVDESRRRGAVLPAGHGVPERSVALLDPEGAPVPDGEIGEFVVSSRYLALGYWRTPTPAGDFTTDPADPEVRVFRTGDLGRRRSDGLFEHVGRKDQQVKLRGHRIEPGEIESALRDYEEVEDAAVVVRRGGDGLPRSLVAYVEPMPDAVGFSPKVLMLKVARRLPAHMVPPAIVPIERLPRLPNFKVDRVTLDSIEAGRSVPAPATNDPVMAQLTGIFEWALGVTDIMPEDCLATLGGDSLQAVHIALEIEKHFGKLPLDVFKDNPSILDLADWITSPKGKAAQVSRRASLAGGPVRHALQ